MNDFEINTPIGKGTIVGMSPDRKSVLVMHTRPKEERSKTKGATYARWWDWDDEKGEISGHQSGSGNSEETGNDAIEND